MNTTLHSFRLLLFLLTISPLLVAGQSYDLIIRNGKIIDGTGNSWFYGDIGVTDGKIVRIGNLKEATGAKDIDAKGLIVAPGFIDVHTHIEGSEIRIPTAGNFIHDGVTSVITGNCGGSSSDIAEYFRKIDSVKTSINIATLIGHNTVRRAVMGESQRDPTAEEQKQMEELVAKSMREGAVGLSTGLIYVPGTYAKTEEVVGLAKASARYGGVYASHIRSEGDHVTEAIDEAIGIGEAANMPVEISHFKVTYKPNWGRSTQTLQQVENARLRGVDVTIDQYPYVASSTTLSTTVPSWVFSGGRDSVQWRLNDPATRLKIKKEMVETLKSKKIKSYSYALIARYAPDSSYNGKTITEVNNLKGRKPKPMNEAETILDLIGSTERVQMVYFSMNEEDLRRIMQYPFNMFASDAGIARYGTNMPHPRAYGTNARVLGMYVRDLKILRLEEAIRRMTSLPATKFNLRDRGLLREGMAADIVIFDEQQVGDRATFEKPHAYSVGFEYIIVNGQVTAEKGKHTGVRNGVVLKRIQ
jgi:N-acyl-D-amino-acid deacylase